MVFDAKLTWKCHVDQVMTRISSAFGMMYRCQNMLNFKWLMTLYNTFFVPFINYCRLIWGSASATALRNTGILQRRALKKLLGVRQSASTQMVYDKTGAFIVQELFQRQVLKCMFQYVNDLIPLSHRGIFTEKYLVSLRTIRNNDRF